jgi:hypothetical protein
MLLKDLISVVREVLPACDHLRRAEYQGRGPYVGHCYVASEAVFHLAREVGVALKPMFVRHESSPHWYLLYNEEPVDLTFDQFSTPVDYGKGRGKGFLTKEPSSRARALIELVRNRLP